MKMIPLLLAVSLLPAAALAQMQAAPAASAAPGAAAPPKMQMAPRPPPPPSSPTDGAVLDASPPSVTVGLPHPMKVATVVLVDELGQTIDIGFKPTGEVTPVAQAPIPKLAPGKYEVRWTAIMASGNGMAGALHFAVR